MDDNDFLLTLDIVFLPIGEIEAVNKLIGGIVFFLEHLQHFLINLNISFYILNILYNNHNPYIYIYIIKIIIIFIIIIYGI